MRKLAGLVILVVVLTGCAATAEQPQIVDTDRYIMCIPGTIDPDQRYPLVIAFSPGADAQGMINSWRGTAEKNKLIILASKEFRNGIDMKPVFSNLISDLKEAFLNYPIDRSKIIVTGFSGGGMGAHAFSFWYPRLTTAIIVNTGMMHEYFKEQKSDYPGNMLAVFLASQTDFRYGEMQADQRFLEDLDWETKWIEFKGGHTMAPDNAYNEAVQWLMDQCEQVF